MSNKQTQSRSITTLVAALMIWFFAGSAFAQSNQAGKAKPVVSKKQTVSLSNTSAKAQKSVAEQNRIDAQNNANKDAAMNTKKAAETKNNTAAAPKGVKTSLSDKKTATAQTNSNQGDLRKDWEKKKARLEQDMKARGMNQYDIDKEILAIEKKLNINNNSNNK